MYFVLICLFALPGISHAQDDYLKINASVNPQSIRQGSEGILKIKITPRNGIKISSYLGFMIKLDDNEHLTFPKVFFTARELDLPSTEEDDNIFLGFEKEIPIHFKVNDASLIGKHKISGEVLFTAVFKDKWSVKTYQKFNADFMSKRTRKRKKK
ncbi:MAG: hypothetical protein GY765_31710 [bacterium]|nr:hypothetical protein [bacterium]